MVLPFWLAAIVVGINLLLLPYLGLILLTALAALCSRRVSRKPDAPRTRFLVVIPAHDEESGIAATVRSCLSLEYPEGLFEVLVIADNCSDDTATIARQQGATVVERQDPDKKSKGHAIKFLIDRLQESGQFADLDALVVIDADTTVSPDLLQAFAGSIEAGRDWIQCFYAVANPDTSWRTRLMAYAFSLFNGVTPLGQSVLGLSAGFRGNGMCFSTRSLKLVPWRSFGLVEDMEYSWNVRIAGGKIAFLPDVRVLGVMLGQGGKAAVSQRRRWEFGRRELSRRVLVPLLRSTHLNLTEKFASVLELTMPPMVLILVDYLCVVAANLLVLLGTRHSAGLTAFLIGSSFLMSLALMVHAICPFLVFQLSWNYLWSLLYLPVYAVWKLPAMISGRPTQWVRTAREEPVKP
jgi:cellulose synthase/poly-beta-1,6-N-acetylglucosamine synthase-like glycosyltransferase